MTKIVDKEDQLKEEDITNLRVLRKKQGYFKRLCAHNRPTYFIIIGMLASILDGTIFPIFAVVWTKVLFVMRDFNNMGSQLFKYCGLLFLIGVVSWIVTFTEKFLFGSLAETMSRNIREETYGAILRRHVGWFDEDKNTPGQLNTILSTEVNTLNGASTESVSIMFQAFCGLLTGVCLALYFEWRISLVALAIAPIMMASASINAKVKVSNMVNIEKGDAKVNSMVLDTITNYSTIKSFANESILIKKYKKILEERMKKETIKCYITGLIFGFSQFITFGMYTIMFWSGAKFVERYNVDGQDLFTAIYIMMFAAIGAGQAQQHGPAAGKGIEAAMKIYNIIDEPSNIYSFKLNMNQRIATNATIKGEIEFRDVWFRYPTRKDNWILKGLSMKIHPNECVGLVGQSGGGKSTIF